MLKVKTKWLKINDLIAKKWRFFLVWLVIISKYRWILSDELGCVFNFLLKKKRTPIRHLKSKKVLFFAEYEEKKKLSRKYGLINNGIYFREKLFLQNQ